MTTIQDCFVIFQDIVFLPKENLSTQSQSFLQNVGECPLLHQSVSTSG